MLPKKVKKRASLLAILLFTSVIGIFLILKALNKNILYFNSPTDIKITGTSTIHSSMLMPLLLMFLVLIVYSALIFLMKYKTEIIRIKKKNLKRYD